MFLLFPFGVTVSRLCVVMILKWKPSDGWHLQQIMKACFSFMETTKNTVWRTNLVSCCEGRLIRQLVATVVSADSVIAQSNSGG